MTVVWHPRIDWTFATFLICAYALYRPRTCLGRVAFGAVLGVLYVVLDRG